MNDILYQYDMRYLLLLFIFEFVFVVSAQNSNEGRISEHAVFSVIAVLGILTITYFVRKSRTSSSSKD